ncbi:MAG: sulfate adenylyltransferase subunit CysD [Planctomycetes bacterium]|nr:sulfate adenylyltransferase subunit CysD [Planctomycetota bacterium]
MARKPIQPATDLLGLDAPGAWDTERAFLHLQRQGLCESKRTAERRLRELDVVPESISEADLTDEFARPLNRLLLEWAMDEARSKRWLVLLARLHVLPTGVACLVANDARGAHFWVPLRGGQADHETVADALQQIERHVGKVVAIFPSGPLCRLCRGRPAPKGVQMDMLAYPPTLDPEPALAPPRPRGSTRTHLDRLEDESIQIIREAVAESENPVMLHSLGKDSMVMMHLAQKAFFPAPPPFPLLHVDTRWKFREMYLFREWMARASGMRMLRHVNPEAVERDINPFDHGSQLHTDITKTVGLKQALSMHRFDLAFGGARRDEEKSRAKERVFSFRTAAHAWDPKNQRPELWNLYNARKNPGESIRVFPLSNWTELDVWSYVLREAIPVVPLYFAKVRPVVEREGAIFLVDDDRMRLLPGDRIERRMVRFRTLGCYPLTGAVESSATTLQDIVLELLQSRQSERQGRVIDHDSAASMEKKKREGYF